MFSETTEPVNSIGVMTKGPRYRCFTQALQILETSLRQSNIVHPLAPTAAAICEGRGGCDESKRGRAVEIRGLKKINLK